MEIKVVKTRKPNGNMVCIIIAIFILQILTAEAFLQKYPEVVLGPRGSGDPGNALFLTPFVEAGNISEARRLARVPLTDSLDITSYSGYFTVNKTYNSNQFFWYFPPINQNNENAPVIIWLQGGPGQSSLAGLFFETGPLKINNELLEIRNYTWASNHHIIYIDNPVGTGFSFTTSTGYCTGEVQVGDELYKTITQFFQLFPELQSNNLYIAGESYGGKYAPALAYTIHKKNPTAQVKINLKGISIGNGLSDPINQLSYDTYLYQLGLLDRNQAKIIEDSETQVTNFIKNQQWLEAFIKTQLFLDAISGMTGLDPLTNYVNTRSGLNKKVVSDFYRMIQSSSFRSSIHVGELSYHNISSMVVYKHLIEDTMQSVAPWISELLEHYNVLTFNGQLDVMVPYPLTVNFLRKLNFTGAEEYKTAKRQIWVVDEEVAGYVKQAGRLTEIMVRNAGHSVPLDQPKWALDLITRFTHEEPYY